MSRTRTWLRRTAVIATTALVLALLPVAAYAAEERPATAGTGGGAVSVTTGVIAMGAALWMAWKRGVLLLVLLAVAAGTMMSQTTFAGSVSDMADNLIRTVINGVSGMFA